MKRCSRN